MTQTRAVFFDRDGTLIVDAGYPNDPKQVVLISEAVPAVKTFLENGFLLVVISNQSGIGRGRITQEQAQSVHKRFIDIFEEQGISITATYYCPHAPEEDCSCRKPSPEMLFKAQKDYDIDLSRSFMIGDKFSDIEAGQRAGCKGILYQPTGKQKKKELAPDLISDDWETIIQFVLAAK